MSNELIVIGASWGGFKTLTQLFSMLSENITVPIMTVLHIGSHSSDFLYEHIDNNSFLTVHEGLDKMLIEEGKIYIAPSSYHMLLDEDMRIALSVEERVCYARPSIDVLFTSAAEVCEDKTIGILLTGANSDGTEGIKKIKQYGGSVIVQNPKEASSPIMPQSAIDSGCVDKVLKIQEIADYINLNFCRLGEPNE